MVTLSFDDVSLTMNHTDYEKFRVVMREAVNSLPIECVKQYEELLGQIGMGYHTYARLYKEKIVDESR
jgi:hypothetical protein